MSDSEDSEEEELTYDVFTTAENSTARYVIDQAIEVGEVANAFYENLRLYGHKMPVAEMRKLFDEWHADGKISSPLRCVFGQMEMDCLPHQRMFLLIWYKLSEDQQRYIADSDPNIKEHWDEVWMKYLSIGSKDDFIEYTKGLMPLMDTSDCLPFRFVPLLKWYTLSEEEQRDIVDSDPNILEHWEEVWIQYLSIGSTDDFLAYTKGLLSLMST